MHYSTAKELRVNLLTPQVVKADGAPKFIAALNAVAEPLRHLDFLFENIILKNNGLRKVRNAIVVILNA